MVLTHLQWVVYCIRSCCSPITIYNDHQSGAVSRNYSNFSATFQMTIDRYYRPTFILSLLFFTSLRLTALGDIPLPLSFSSPLAPGTDNIVNMFKVRWERNGSARYDGRTQDIPEDWIIESDRDRGVNESIRVEWGQSGRLWNALVLEKKPVPTPLDLALPAKRVKTASPCKFPLALSSILCMHVHVQ